jgi:DNA mismatch repair ATPase MutS
LQKLQGNLSGNTQSATESVRKLSKISAAFDYRLNLLMGIILNIFLLWDLLQLIRLERWKYRHSQELEIWFQALYQIDELNSFAGFAFNHPESVYPDFSIQDFEIHAANAKHPFIERSKSVGNPIIINGMKDFQVITGANMAGKSTYLRTVGVNLLLGMTGAPVLADSFRFKPTPVFTSIRTSDSLQDGESYFFAELKRLKQLIDLLETDTQMFIILDEILRGTNSADKRKGSKSLIRQLLKLGASGMIATHDLALGELAEDFPNNIQNKRFEVEIVNGDLHFDYKLKDGISRNLNATFLMKKMGITVD